MMIYLKIDLMCTKSGCSFINSFGSRYEFFFNTKLGVILPILLAANVILAALAFFIFHQDGIWLNWELKELVACEVGRCVHLRIVHIGVRVTKYDLTN